MEHENILNLDLFGHMESEEQVFAILDAARRQEVAVKPYEFQTRWVSLYRGEPEEALYDVAPYLVFLGNHEERNQGLIQWVEKELWGDSCGVFIYSKVGLDELFEHFQKFLIVSDEGGTPFYFRFYDPRILRCYLPTCNEDELRIFFGPVSSFVMESRMSNRKVCFSLSQNGLEISENRLIH